MTAGENGSEQRTQIKMEAGTLAFTLPSVNSQAKFSAFQQKQLVFIVLFCLWHWGLNSGHSP
jgi:hypothetical protein